MGNSSLLIAKSERTNGAHPELKRISMLRAFTASLLVLLTIAYMAGIVSGYLPRERRIDAVSLALIALGAGVILVLLHPEVLDRLKRLEMSGFKLEMLERVREKQAKQEMELDDMSLIFPLLMPETEQQHLVNLTRGRTTDYSGNHLLRSELRRLRFLGLIRTHPGKAVAKIMDGTKFDLADYVGLTDLGKRWAKRITEIKAQMAEAGAEE